MARYKQSQKFDLSGCDYKFQILGNLPFQSDVKDKFSTEGSKSGCTLRVEEVINISP